MENKRLNFIKDFAKDFEPYEFDTYGYIRLPEIEITRKEFSKADVDPDSGPTHEDFLRLLVEKSFNQYLNEGIIPEDRKQDYIDRYERELKTFFELNFTDYVLLVWKVINFCEDTGIMTSFGRGSGGGSCVFYLLKITHTDPIKYELFFERFISKARAKSKVIDGVVYIDGDLAPDYDLDVQIEKRGEVIDYLKSLYKNRICKISTFSTLSSKIVMKECGKAVLNKSEEEMNDVSGMIAKNHGILEDLDVSYKLSPNFKKWVDQNKKAYDIALKLRGLIKNYSVHASGFVVAYDDLNDFLPLRLTKDNEIASAYEKETVALLTIKLDILGVRCLSVVKDILTRLNLDWRKINVDDNKIVYDILKKGLKHSHGIFQLEADCNYRVCNLVKPKDINELSDVVAIARPGALAFTHDYVNRSQEGIHPLFDPILSSTRFTILYQEQLMKLANQIGFTLEEAELLRRIVGRKKIKEVGEWKEKIEAKIKENNLPEELGILLWETFEASSKYSFNRSHSLAYASLAALTVYLKYKYPLEFFIALLNQCKNESDSLGEVGMIERELSDFGIKLLRPHLIKSEMSFSIEEGNIRYGLESIKGVSGKTIEKLFSFKTKYDDKYRLLEAAKRSGINIGVVSSMIQAGALEDDFGEESRSKAVLEAQLYNILTDREKKFVFEFKEKIGDDLVKLLTYFRSKNIIKESRLQTIRKKYKKYMNVYEANIKHRKFVNYVYERKMLGYAHSYRLRETMKDRDLSYIEDVIKKSKDTYVKFIGIISDFATGTKNGRKWLRYNIFDERAAVNVLLFGDKIDDFKNTNDGELAQKDQILYVKGKMGDDCVFAHKITIQDRKIYLKINELKNE